MIPKMKSFIKKILTRISLLLFLILCGVFTARSQEVTVHEVIDFALKNNPRVKAAGYETQAQQQIRKSSFDLPKTEVMYMRGQYNSFSRNDNNITIQQSIPFSVLGSQGSLNREKIVSAQLQQSRIENELALEIRQTCNDLAYANSRMELLVRRDSAMEEFFKIASLRFEAGETNLLEKETAQSQRNDSKNKIFQLETEIIALKFHLMNLLNVDKLPEITPKHIVKFRGDLEFDSTAIGLSPTLAFSKQQIEVAHGEQKVARAKSAPDLIVGYFNQTLIGAVDPESGSIASSKTRFNGFMVGVALPLWYEPHHARVKASEYSRRAAESNFENDKSRLTSDFQRAWQQFRRSEQSIEFFERTALANAKLVMAQATKSFSVGETSARDFLMSMQIAITVQDDYLQALRDFNQSVIYLQFLSGNK